MPKFYAVAVGHNPGIYRSWDDCSEQVTGYSRAKFKKFQSREEAQEYLDSFRQFQYSSSSDEYESKPEQPRMLRVGGVFLQVQKIYTDGSARGNQYEWPDAGYGVYFGPGDPRNASVALGEVEGRGVRHTNQRAELHAVGHALKVIEQEYNRGYNLQYEIYTDSRYVINALEVWVFTWRNRNWASSAGHEVVNRDIIEDASDRLDSLHDRGVKISLHHIKGHGSCQGNIEADRLANLAAEKDFQR